jgi:hypothetical protein
VTAFWACIVANRASARFAFVDDDDELDALDFDDELDMNHECEQRQDGKNASNDNRHLLEPEDISSHAIVVN